jgi:hypothetical protein
LGIQPSTTSSSFPSNGCQQPWCTLPEDHGGGLKNLVALLAADKGELEQQQQEQSWQEEQEEQGINDDAEMEGGEEEGWRRSRSQRWHGRATRNVWANLCSSNNQPTAATTTQQSTVSEGDDNTSINLATMTHQSTGNDDDTPINRQ